MGWVAPGGDEFSMSGSIEKSLGRRCWSRIGVWTLTFGEVRYPGTDVHLGLGIGGWAWEGLETVITSFYSSPFQCLQNATTMAPLALQRGQRAAAVAVGGQAVLQMLSKASGRQVSPAG